MNQKPKGPRYVAPPGTLESPIPQAPTIELGKHSVGIIDQALWFSSDFLIGAGLVIIQPSTGKVVVVHDQPTDSWFLPKGRKDVGETIEQAALREGYEESGYRATFLPLYLPSRQPIPPEERGSHRKPTTTEPIYIDVRTFHRSTQYEAAQAPQEQLPSPPPPAASQRRRSWFGLPSGGSNQSSGTGRALPEVPAAPPPRTVIRVGEYITFWFVGQIEGDAVAEKGTGMPDEVGFTSHLLDPEEAMERLGRGGLPRQVHVVQQAISYWHQTREVQAKLAQQTPDPPSQNEHQ